MIYASQKTLASLFDISRTTVWQKLKGMQAHPIYGKDVIRDGRFVRIKVESFEEYLKCGQKKHGSATHEIA